MKKRTKTMADRIYDLAVALCENRNVWFMNHSVRRIEVPADKDPCEECSMDSVCDDDMNDLCALCDRIKENKGYLQLNGRSQAL